MSEERVRRQVRELVEGFGPPNPGLAARAVAGLPDRPAQARARWIAATTAAVLAVGAVAVLLFTAHGAISGPTPPTNLAGFAPLRQRPLQAIPLVAGRPCQVDQGRASVRGTMDPLYVTYVSASMVPPDELMTILVDPKPRTASTISVIAGSKVSGPVLVRGHRVDGPGAMTFAPTSGPSGLRQHELELYAAPGRQSWGTGFVADGPGCYAIQFDGARFTEAAVLQLLAPYSPSPDTQPNTRPTPRIMSLGEAAATVRAEVTSVQPVLLPRAVVGPDWRAQVTTASDSFAVSYTDPTGARQVTVATISANPPLPTDRATQTHPSFHGDRRSLYQVNDGSDPHSARFLMWREPGTSTHPDPSYPGVDYFVSSTGLTDAEFWQLANSLR